MTDRNRRKFLQNSAAGIAGAALTAKSVSAASQDRVAGTNRRLRVGLIGCGGQGSGQ